MNYSAINSNINACISRMSIEYINGFYEVFELATPVSKHASLSEAQWIKSMLENDKNDYIYMAA